MDLYTEIKGYPGYFINQLGNIKNAKKTNNSTTGYYATKQRQEIK